MLSGEPAAYVYILASERNGTLYIGSAVHLEGRISDAQAKASVGFYAQIWRRQTRLV